MFTRMSRLAVLAAILAALPITSSAAITLGTVTVGIGYTRYGGFCCPGPYDGFYGPFWVLLARIIQQDISLNPVRIKAPLS